MKKKKKKNKFKQLTVVKEKELTRDMLKDFVQYKVSYKSLIEGTEPIGHFHFCDYYEVQLKDLEIALEQIKTKINDHDADMESDYADWIYEIKYGLTGIISFPEVPRSDNPNEFTEELLIEYIIDRLSTFHHGDRNDPFVEYRDICVELIEKIQRDIQAFKEGKIIYPWKWSREQTIQYIMNLHEDEIDVMDEQTLRLVRESADELCAMNEPHILEKVGYFCYGGNRLYCCDWVKSRDIFLKLMNMENVSDKNKCHYANTLGYIFYYGRCSNGVPEYEKAFKYYSIGAAGGIYESIYKLSDLYYFGDGVPQNMLAASNCVQFIYPENLEYIQSGYVDGKFADVALRMGRLCQDEVIDGDAYYFFTLADYAIRRRLPYDFYGDSTVFYKIEKELEKIRTEMPLIKMKKYYSNAHWLNMALTDNSCKISLKKVKKGIKITARRLYNPHNNGVNQFFICIPECGYCDLTHEVSETVLGIHDYWTLDGNSKIIADQLDYTFRDKKNYYVFLHHGEEVAVIEAAETSFKIPK